MSIVENGPGSAKGDDRPPNRGANIVVTIHHTDASCPKLQKALVLLGTYYNLFVIVDGSGLCPDAASTSAAASNSDKNERELIKTFRSKLLQHDEDDMKSGVQNTCKLSAQVIPPHRIVFSKTQAGRVAFVRQLHGAELIVDKDEKVANELRRFGFRVLLYPSADTLGSSTSALGEFLIP